MLFRVSHRLRFALLFSTVLATITVAGLAVTARPGSAQAPPTDPLDQCCELMAPGGRTIAGPAVRTMGAGEDFLFQSPAPRDVCVTFANLNPDVAFTVVRVEVEGIATPLAGGPGETQTVCSRTRSVRIVCETSGPNCRYRWRIDAAS